MDTRQNDGTAGRHWLRSHPGPPPAPAATTTTTATTSLFDVPAGYPTIISSGNHGNNNAGHATAPSFTLGGSNSASSSLASSPSDPMEAQQQGQELNASQHGRSTRRNRRSVYQNHDPVSPHSVGTLPDHPEPQQQQQQQQYAQGQRLVFPHEQQQFAVPALPMSAPASTSNFFHDNSQNPTTYGLRSSFNGLSDSSQVHVPNHVYSQQTQNHTSNFSHGHVRSASAASATPSHSSYAGGPLSASTSSAASSNYGDSLTSSSLTFSSTIGSRSTNSATGASSPAPTVQRGNRLTAEDRRQLCIYAERNPRMKHDNIGKFFGIERSTVSKILKNRARWMAAGGGGEDQYHLSTNTAHSSAPSSPSTSAPSSFHHHDFQHLHHGGPASPSPMQNSASAGFAPGSSRNLRQRTGKYPELEAALAEWGRVQTSAGIVVTDEQVRSQALELARQTGSDKENFKASAGWLENFKQRWGYRNGRFLLAESQIQGQGQGGEEMNEGSDETDRSAPPPIWPAPSPVGSTSAAFFSPLGHRNRSRAATGNSLSSSSTSLPGLAEEEAGDTDDNFLQGVGDMYGSGSSGLLSHNSSSSSFGIPQHIPSRPRGHLRRNSSSYSTGTCSSPNPSSEYSSMTQEDATNVLRDARSTHLSTPTQQSLYTSYGATPGSGPPSSAWESPAYRMHQAQQAGLNFQLTLNSNTPTQQVRQQQQSQNRNVAFEPLGTSSADGQMAFEGSAYPSGMVDATAGVGSDGATTGNYALRSRMQSAPQNGSALRAPRVRHPTHPAPLLGMQEDHQQTLSARHRQYQQKMPLHRSNTDPMPIMQTLQNQQEQLEREYQAQAQAQAMQQQQGQSEILQQNVLDSTQHTMLDDGGGSTSMQIDGILPPHHPASHSAPLPQSSTSSSSSTTATPNGSNAIVQPVQHNHLPHHPRRATISTGSEATAYGTFGSYYGPQLVVGGGAPVMTPVFGQFGDVSLPGNGTTSSNNNSDRISFEDAYLALRKVVGYLQSTNNDSNNSNANQQSSSNMTTPVANRLAAPEDLQVLDNVLAQFREAHIARVHSLTPPSST